MAKRRQPASSEFQLATPRDEGSALRDNPARGVEVLLHQAEQALASVDAPSEATAVRPFPLRDFTPADASGAHGLNMIGDVELELKIELGRTQMVLEDVLKLHAGSVVTLDRMSGDPVDVFAGGRLIARGEVLVLDGHFCVRITEIVAGPQGH